MSEREETKVGRRDFFKKAGLGAGAAVVAAATTQAGAAETAVPQKKSAGYTETDHVRTFYDLARF